MIAQSAPRQVDPISLPGNVIRRAFWADFWAPANTASNVVFGITALTALLAMWFAPGAWLLIAAVVGVASAAGALLVGRDRTAVYDMVQWMWHEAGREIEEETGAPDPRSIEEARLWLASPASTRARPHQLSDVLRVVGELPAARAILDNANPSTADDIAEIECSRFELDFVERGTADFGPWLAAIGNSSRALARHHRVEVALSRAMLDHAAGRAWLPGLRRAHANLAPFEIPLSMRALPILNRIIFPVGGPIALIGIGAFLFEAFRVGALF